MRKKRRKYNKKSGKARFKTPFEVVKTDAQRFVNPKHSGLLYGFLQRKKKSIDYVSRRKRYIDRIPTAIKLRYIFSDNHRIISNPRNRFDKRYIERHNRKVDSLLYREKVCKTRKKRRIAMFAEGYLKTRMDFGRGTRKRFLKKSRNITKDSKVRC